MVRTEIIIPTETETSNGTDYFAKRQPLEEATLGCLVLDWPQDQHLQMIDPHWFRDATNRRLFEFLKQSREKNLSVDPVARWHDLQPFEKKRLYLDCYDSVTSTAMLPTYVAQMRQRYVSEETRRIVAECGGRLTDEDRRRLKTLMDDAETVGEGTTFATPAHLMPQIIEAIEKRHLEKDKGPEYPTFHDLDAKTDGLHCGELWVIGAYTSVGKTLFMSTMAKHLTDIKKRVLYFTTEMQKDEYLQSRWLPSFAGVHALAIRSGNLQQTDWNKLAVGAGRLSQVPLWIVDTSRPSLAHIRNIVKQVQPDVLFLDHIHRCELPKAENQNLALTMFVSGLKTMARDLSVPVVAAAQLNRSSQTDTKPPSLAHLRDSGSLEMESDVVVLLSRKYEGGEPRPIIRAEVAKNRHGELGAMHFRILGAEMRVQEMQEFEVQKALQGSR